MKTQFLRDPLTEAEWLEVLQNAIKEKKIDLTYKTSVSLDLASLVIDKYTEKFTPPNILIAVSAFLKMMSLVQSTDKEIAWHGVVQKVEEGLLITDILVYPQETSGTTADADEELYGPWIVQNHKIVNQLRMQGHSHVNMSVFASGTDMDSFKKLMNQVKDYYIFMIVNKKWEMKCYYADVASGIFYEDIPVTLATKNPFNLSEWTKEQMKNVTPKKYVNHYGGTSVSGNYPTYSSPTPQKKETPKNLASADPDDDDSLAYPINKKYERRKI